MKIIYIHRKEFHKRPPVISVIQYLSELGYHPHVITTGINDTFKGVFAEKSIPYTLIPFNMGSSIVMNTVKGILWGVKARREVRRIAYKEKVVLWIEGNYTFTSLTPRFINRYPHILQVQEVPDTESKKGQYQLKTLGKIMSTALANFAPEYNRAFIYTAFFRLKETPFVIPNKPAFLPSRDDLASLNGKFNDIIHLINGRKVILYQGLITNERNLDNYLMAASTLDPEEFVVVLLGKSTSVLDKYKKILPSLIHVEYIPAPDYLFITSLAYIGIVTYNPDKLNTVYCAPNKIFEYSAFGVPMIGNDIPGLKYTIHDSGCGLVCDSHSVEDIKEKFYLIIKNYKQMSTQASLFFNLVDNKSTIKKAIELVENRLNTKLQ